MRPMPVRTMVSTKIGRWVNLSFESFTKDRSEEEQDSRLE